MNPLVSVIITTKNEQDMIRKLLESIKRQAYKNIEIILVDNNSDDHTKKIARKYTTQVYNFGPERSAQRNYGAGKSKGKYLLFLDADMELTRNVVKKCVSIIQKNTKTGAIIIKEVPVAKTFWEKVKAFERSFYNQLGDETTDAARFFDANLFRKINGYDEKITGPEDWDITDRVKKRGFQIPWVDTLIYHYERVPNPIKLARKKYYYGLKSHRYIKKQNIKLISSKTIYILRPVFLKNWKNLLIHPILTLSMFIMLTAEQIGGGLGYLLGKYKNE